MKSFKLIAGLLAGATLLTTGCKKEFEGGEDSSKAVPTDLSFVTLKSADAGDTLAFRWNAQPLIAQGATSFSIEICDDPAEPVNTYDDVIQTIKSSEIKDGTGIVYFTTGISEYTEKYVRIRANYGSKFSKWAFGADDKGEPAVFVAGHGIKDTDKAAVGAITMTDCPADGNNFTVKADLTPASSASRVLAILMDYAAQKAIWTEKIENLSASTFEKKFEDLTSGKLYQFKMLAEYDVEGKPTHVADWSYAEGEAVDEDGETKTTNVIQCGKGLVIVNGVPPTTKVSTKLSGQLGFQWSEFGFSNIGKDAAIPVKVALYKDAACKDLVYGWTIQKYTISGRQPTIVFSNLEPNTSYWFVCQDLNTGLISDALEAKTADFDIVTVGAEKVKEKGVAVAENFSELYFGGYAMDFSPCPGNNGNAAPHPEVGTWDSANLVWTDGNHGFFNTLGNSGAVKNSRFKDWGVIHGLKDGTGASVPGDLCIRTGMFQMGASSGIPILCTPELTNLQGLATVKVSFNASSMWEKGVIKEATDADFQSIAVYTVSGGKTNYTVGTSYGTITDATVKEAGVVARPATDVKTPTWETKTVTVKNVSPGTRIGIGAVRAKTGNQRWLLNMVKVEVVSYGVPKLETPVLKNAEISKTKAKFTFEAQDMAQSYELGYKKSSDSEYTYIESESPEFSLTGLNVNTTYLVRVVSKAGDYSSTTPFFYEFTTENVDFKYPLSITNAEDFVEWMTTGAEFTSTADVVNLETDLDLNGISAEAMPITNEFNGTFNGNNHVIKNFKTGHALFNNINGTVKDLIIDASCSFEGLAVNAPLALKSTGTISNISNKASVNYNAASFSSAVILGGVVANVAGGKIENCTNDGAITAKSEGTTLGMAIGGVAGRLAGAMNNCLNNAAINISAKYVSKLSTIEGTANVAPCVGGLVGLGGAGFSMSNSDNKGKVVFTNTEIEKTESSIQRISVAGIAGAPNGKISKCNNYADVDVKLVSSGKAAFNDQNYVGVIGGISGGDYYAAGQDATNIEDCVNEGAISFYNDGTKSNSAFGGIVGWPGIESAQKVATKNCTNKGKITFSGFGKARIGGVQGGTGNMEGCSNEGAVILESGNSGSVLGSLCGFHSQAHTIKSCKALGSVTAKATVGGIGGLIGNNGNAANTSGEGCIVNCTISGGDANNSGLIIGLFNGNSKKITLGSTSNPIKVSGTVNGTTVTADNFKDLLHGSKNFKAENHILNAVFGK